MTSSNFEVADVIRQFGEAYIKRYPNILPSQRRALRDISDCMTPAMGGSMYHCDDCGESFWRFHGCGNRSCPKCHGPKTAEWLEARQSEMLPCNYFHIVATVPEELRSAALRHQKIIYGLLMKTAADCVRKLAADPKYVGGEVGILAVLHTWTGQLLHHPHVHMLVSGGGITQDGLCWTETPYQYLVPVHKLSKMIREQFSADLKKDHPEIHRDIPKKTWTREWCSFCKHFGKGQNAVLEYLARYVFRIAISNARILDMNETHVKIRYKDHDAGRWAEARIPGEEFIRRFLLHVLPKGFHKVRYYGLWSPVKRRQLTIVRLMLELKQPVLSKDDLVVVAQLAEEALAKQSIEKQAYQVKCPKCRGSNTVLLEALDPWRNRLVS